MIILYIFLLLVIVLALLLSFRKDNIISLEQAKNKNETDHSFYFSFQNQKQHYTEKGSGETVVLIHGLGDSFQNYDEFAEILSKNYRVIRIDLPGFGLSEIPKVDPAKNEIIEYYQSFLTSFFESKGINDFHLFGNSLGGLISWNFAIKKDKLNIKSLTLLASAGFEMVKVKKNVTLGLIERIPRFVLKKGAPLQFSKMAADTCIVNKSIIRPSFINAHNSMFNKSGTIDFFLDLIENDFIPETEKLKSLQVPTLIVWGQKDKIAPVQHASLFEDALPNSRKVIYPKCGHYPQIEEAKKLYEDWQNFLKGI